MVLAQQGGTEVGVPAMDLAQARALWPGIETKAFLDAACCSIIPSTTRQALLNATLLIALVESTTYRLNIAATCLELPPGSTVLVSDLKFLQVAITWTLQRDRGISVEVVSSNYGRIQPAGFEKSIDETAKMIVISSVLWCNGWRADLEAFGELCQRYGLYFVVDAVHHAGIVDLDLKKCHVDVLTTGGHKWLISPFCCGMLYIDKELLPTIQPKMWGYLAPQDPEGGWSTYFGTPSNAPVADWKFRQSAKQFEIASTANYLGAIALGESLKIANAIGIKGVYVAMRFTSDDGGIRVSCHYFNNRSDTDRLTVELRRAAAEKAPDFQPPYGA